jgi:hypothetical protein
VSVPNDDRRVLRELGKRLAEIGHLPVQKTKADLWRQLNSLKPTRPLVFIDEVPWWEMDVDGELTPRCADEFCRTVETAVRRRLYQWEHFPGDMVVDPWIECPYVIHDSGFGIEGRARRSGDGLVAADYEPVITSEDDVEKIRMPRVRADWDATERRYELMQHVFDGVLPVRKMGIKHRWCAPWDVLIQWWGIEELYVDMIDRPALVHRGISRLMDALLCRLEQWERQGLLSVGNNNHRVGSGGIGITDELPQPDYDGRHARCIDQWGTSTGQIFSEVSPDMHEEFCLRYERRWLERFGLNCYGCCEPLHNKMHLMRTIPRLRRISMSPWVDVAVAAERTGTDYIFSSKPNPAVVAAERWDPDAARAALTDTLAKTRGCLVELILKDISTVRNEPRRLWEWEDVAMEVVQQ